MKDQKIYIYLLIGLFCTLSSCLKVGEFYLGLNMQPNMKNSPSLPGLNVFGILKTGPDVDTINHFFEVQRMINLNTLEEQMLVENAVIRLTRTTRSGDQSYYFPKYYGNGLYFEENIETAPGDKWEYFCAEDTFEISSSCTIPNIPVIESKIEVSAINGYSFTLKADSSAFMYLVYIIQDNDFQLEKVIPETNKNTTVIIKPGWEIKKTTSLIYIFAYDVNLREYNTTSNTLFKPNAFRPSFSTVRGGYGSFGAISSCMEIVSVQ